MLEQSERKRILGRLTRANLDLIVFKLVSKQPMHGYALIAAIRKIFGTYLGPSTIYPMLGVLEEKGYIKGSWDTSNLRPKKVYTLTGEGMRLLSLSEECLDHTLLMLRNMETMLSLKKASHLFP